MVGESLGHYRIVQLLGKGGMGEVYVAEDTRLNRQVALKVLPSELAGDAERRARFEREAQAVAALNHPNIVTIHSVEEIDGQHFITMELVKGRSLSELLPNGGLSTDRFLELAIPLSAGVAAAHEQGITHRDLKPENVMVGDDGRLRILDFGLAKLAEGPISAGGSASDEMPTQTVTQEGRVLGTVAYMSPEQAEGKPVDHRTDIFSLGVIFYEMATGKRPFEGDTSMSVLTSIMRDDPGSVTDLNARLPRQLGRFVKRCLQKDPTRRYQSALDLRNELEELQEEVATGQATPVGGPTTSGPTRRKWVLPVALTLAVLGVGFGLWSSIGSNKETDSPQASANFQSMQIRNLTSSGGASQVAISPDGKYVAYLSEEGRRPSLRIKQVATGSDVEIVPEEDIWFRNVLFTPDGDYIVYQASMLFDAPADLYQIPTLGGTPRKLMSDVNGEITLSPDGTQIAFLRHPGGGIGVTQELWVANLDGSSERLVTKLNDGLMATPAWAPDGQSIAFGTLDFEALKMRLQVAPVEGGEMIPLSDETWDGFGSLSWYPDGSGLLVTAFRLNLSGPQIWEVAHPSGDIRRITNDLNSYSGISLTADGQRLATVQSETRSALWLQDLVDSEKAPTVIPTTTGSANGDDGVAWSPSGQIAFTADEGTEVHIWVMNPDGSNARRLTTALFNQNPCAHPDGRQLVLERFDGEVLGIVLMDLDDGSSRLLAEDEVFAMDASLSGDGSELFYRTMHQGQFHLLRRPLAGGEATLVAENLAHQPSFSPDGTRMALHMLDPSDGRIRTAILPAEGGEVLQWFDFHSEQGSPWGPDGESLYHAETRDGVMNIYLMPLNGGEPKQLTRFTEGEIFDYAVSPDHSQLLIARGQIQNDIVLIEKFR